jgi:hypothetical protein
LGTIFLSAIGLVVASLVRSWYGTANRNAVRDGIENASALDPLEIDDLRAANSELTPEIFRELVERARDEDERTYREFIEAVRKVMVKQKGEAFTVELGHLLDRVVVAAVRERGGTTDDPMPSAFWWTVLSMALHGTASERIELLWAVLAAGGDAAGEQREDGEEKTVSLAEVTKMVQYLQDTCQLVPDAQVIPTTTKYPVQQYKKATAVDMVSHWCTVTDAGKAVLQQAGDRTEQAVLDLDAFAALLRSKSVCAWGECYHRRKDWRVPKGEEEKVKVAAAPVFELPPDAPAYLAANQFEGSRRGYVFKMGSQGLGYYQDHGYPPRR